MRLEGKTVLITGASSGIGKAASAAFVVAGCRVIAVARDEPRLEALSHSLGGPDKVLPIVADVTDSAGMAAMTSRVLGETGCPDVIVAGAGVGLDALFAETSDEALRELFEVNVFGLVRTVRPFVGPMTERGTGRILLISSIVGKRGIPHYSGYSASKFALHGMAEALRSELYGSGVSVGLVCPSSTDTEFEKRRANEGPPQKRFRPRTHSAESVARAIVRMAGSRRKEVVTAVDARLMSFVNRVWPGAIDWLLARTLTAGR